MTTADKITALMGNVGMAVDARDDNWIRFVGRANRRYVTITIDANNVSADYPNELFADAVATIRAGGEPKPVMEDVE